MGLRTRLHIAAWYAALLWRRRNRPDYTLMRGPGIPEELLRRG